MTWCSECGGEHRDTAVECVFCGGALVDVEPAAPVEDDHSVATVEIGDLDPSQRSMLELLATSEGLHIELTADRVSVAAVDAATLTDVLSQLRAVDPLDEAVAVPRDEPGDVTGVEREVLRVPSLPEASTPIRAGTRVLSMFLNGLALAVFTGLLGWVAGPSDVTGWAVWVLIAVLEIWLVATRGWDVAKLFVGLRVVDERGDPPGWRRATVRALVLMGPVIGAGLLADALATVNPTAASILSWIGVVWLLLVLTSIANGQRHQGWHDRLAGTLVVNRPRR